MNRIKLCFVALAAALSLVSCYDTRMTSSTGYKRSMAKVQKELESQGYSLTGSPTDTRNEVTVTGQSYSRVSGYGTKMDNKYVTRDNYNFTHTDGSTLKFSVTYSPMQNANVQYVENMQVSGCETSNKNDYNKLCGSSAAIQSLNNAPKDTSVEIYNPTNTYLLTGGISVLAGILLYAIIL